jgi:hypothetical protein
VNQAPAVTGATVSIAENSPNGSAVHTVVFTDPDIGQTHTFAITAGNTTGAFAIDPGTGALSVADGLAVDFETTPSFSLTVAVTDNGSPPATGTAAITIDLTDVNDAPVVDPATFSVAENSATGTPVGTVTFTDQDAGQTHVFAVTAGNTGGVFTIDPATGEVTLAGPVDFETTSSYSLTVEVTDDGTPAMIGSVTITVDITNLNEPPSIAAPASISTVRDVAVVVTGISVADPDAGNIELSLAVVNGTLEIDETASTAVVVGDGTATVLITGTVTEINDILADANGVTYLNDAGFAGPSDTLNLDIDDLGGPPLTASATVTIEFNEVPVAADLTLSTAEDTPLVVTLSATDGDDDDLTFAIMTEPSNGTLSVIGPVDCTTVANTCTADVTYTPNVDFNGPDQFTYEASDGVSTDTATVDISVTPVNDAPVITLSASTPAFTEGDAGVAVDDGLTVTDIDDTELVSGDVSIIAGLVTGDTLSFTPAGGIVDTDPADDVLALSGTTTLANWQTTLQSVQFMTASDNPTGATRSVSFTVNDGDLDSAVVTKDVTVVPINDAPVLSQPDATAVDYTENDPATVIAPNITATDVDSTNLIGASIAIGTGYVNGQDVLGLGTNPQNGINATFDAATGTLTLTGASSGANYQAALRDVRYANSSEDPTAGARTISFQVDDGDDLSNIVSRDLTMTAVNDPPTAPTHTYDATANMAVDIPVASGLLAGATDAEAGTTLTVGVISVTTPAGGNITDLDPATGAFRFNPPPGVTGAVTFTYTVCDNGNPGPGVCSAPATVTFNVAGPVIWFVDDSAAAGGTGRLTDPFQTITAASTAIAANANQRVFAYSGTYTQGITLNSGGWLVGQQTTGAGFDAVMLITPPAGTIARPAIATGTATLQNTVALNSNAVIRGIAINSGANTALTESVVAAITGVDVTQTTITTTSGTALSLSDVAGTLTFTDLDKNGTGTGVSLTNVAANVTIPAAGSIGGTSVAGVDIDGGTGAFSFAGPINNSTGGRTIEVTNHSTGAVQFTGGVNGIGTGVFLDNNDTSTISFTGGLSLNTSTNAAFTATNGGTVTAVDPGGPSIPLDNIITTSTGTALNVTGTNIGAAGLNFRSISANGAANGIVLNGTGTAGGLTVTGNGAAGTGGTIQNITNRGVSADSGADISLSWMTFTNAATTNGADPTDHASGCGDLTTGGNLLCNAPIHLANISRIGGDPAATLARLTITNSAQVGINLNNVDGLSLTNTTLSGIGNQTREYGIKARNLFGPVTLDALSITNSFGDHVRIDNNGAQATTLNLTNSAFSTTTEGNGFVFNPNGTAATVVNVASSSFSNSFSTGLIIGPTQPTSGGTVTIDVTGGPFTNNNAGIQIFGNGTTDVTYDVHDIANISGNPAAGIQNDMSDQAQSTASLIGTIQSNTVTMPSSGAGNGIGLTARGAGTSTILVTGNTVTNTTQYGILLHRKEGLAPGTMNATVTSNTVTTTDTAADLLFPIDSIRVEAGAASADTGTVCAQISGNTANGAGSVPAESPGDDIRLRMRFAHTFQLPGLVGSDAVAAINLLNANNPASGTISATTTTTFSSTVSCPTPP